MTDNAAESLAQALERIGPYRIVEKLGAGAMGVVYLAEDTRLHRRVALKTLPRERGWTPEARRRLMHEAEAAGRLAHPNIATIYDVVETPDRVHIVMEYVEGETLSARLRRGRIPRNEVIRIGRQLAEGLAKAHEMGILHRDLKPGNVMLQPDGSVKILDFGLAKIEVVSRSGDAKPGSPSESLEGIVGTPGYIPPERLVGRSSDARGDVYGLGVMLFELLTGQRPFEERDIAALTEAVLTRPAPRPREIDPSIPPSLDDIVWRAMARSPEDRPSSAAEFSAALVSLQEEQSRATTRTLGLRPDTKIAHRGWIYLTAAVAVGGAIVAAIYFPRPGPTQISSEVQAEYSQAESFLARRDVPGNLDHAINLFRGVVDKEPRLVGAHAGLGLAYWFKYLDSRDDSWADKALLAMTEALRLDPNDAAARHGLAVVFAGRGHLEEALEEVERALVLDPRHDKAHAMRGNLLFEAGRREEGVRELQKAIDLQPAYWQHHYDLGLAHYDSGRYTEALAAFSRVAELQPDSPRGFLMLGTTHHAKGEVSEAVTNYRKAIKLGADAAAHTNLGVLLYAEKRYEEAGEAFEQAALLKPSSPAKHRNLGDVYRKLGRELDAVAAYERAVKLGYEQLRINPKDPWALARLAVYEAQLGHRDEALRLAEEAVGFGPEVAGVVYRRAVVLALLGEIDQSLEVLADAVRMGYSRDLASADEDLQPLHKLPEFQVLIDGSIATVLEGDSR